MFAFCGFPAGIASMTVPVYIAEVSPPNLRGRLVTVNTLFITGGQFFASVVDGAFSYLQKDGWRSVNSILFNFQVNHDLEGWEKIEK